LGDPGVLGLDAAVPAAFLALLWPQLRERPRVVVALAGALVALAAVPFAPAGVPVLLAALVVLPLVLQRGSPGAPRSADDRATPVLRETS
jgi:predicted branched-subunit amino acid permease